MRPLQKTDSPLLYPAVINKTIGGLVAALLTAIIGLSSASAATFTWDASGANPGSPTDGSGTWSTTGTDWGNGVTDSPWTNGSDAVIGNGGTAGTITVSGGVAADSITFNPVASGTYYSITGSTITLTGSGAIVTNAASATISSVLASSVGLTKSGTGTLTLSGADSYSGATNVNAGTLAMVNNIGGFASASTSIASGATFSVSVSASTPQTVAHTINFNGTGTLLMNGPGTWVIGANGIHANIDMSAGGLVDIEGGTIQNNFNGTSWGSNFGSVKIASGATLDLFAENGQMDALTGAGTLQNSYAPEGVVTVTVGVSNGSGVFGGVISGVGGGLNLAKAGTGTETLTGANTYAGTTKVNGGGTLKLDFSAATAPASNIINNSSNSSALTLGYGTLLLNGGSTTANSQRVNGLALTGSSGNAIVLTTNATAQNLLLTLGAITRNAGSTIDFTEPSGTLSSSNGITTTSGTASTILNIGGVDYATANGGSDWAAIASSNSLIVPLSTISGGYTASTSGTLSGNADVTNGVTTTTLTGADTITSLRFNQPQATTINLGSNALVTGGILDTGNVGNNLSAITSGTLEGIAGSELDIFQYDTANSLAISATIADNTSATTLVESGPGTLALTGSNTYTGGTVIDSGVLSVNADAALGGINGKLTFGGAGTLLAGGSNVTLVGSRGIAINSGVTGTISGGTNSITINGVISGAGSLITTGAVTFGGANTYSGNTVLQSGTLIANNAGALGVTTGTLTMGNASTGANPITFQVGPSVAGGVVLSAINITGTGGQTIVLNAGSSLASNATELTATINLIGNTPLTLQGTNTGGHATAQDFSGAIFGTGIAAGNTALIIDGSVFSTRITWGGSNLTTANNFTGDVIIKGTVTTQNTTFSGGGSQNMGFLHNNVTVNSGASWSLVWGGETVGALNGSGNISLSNQNALNNIGLTIGNTGISGTYGGGISGGFGVAKVGAGTEIFTGGNGYTGNTVINQGTLQLGNNGTTGSISASSAVSGSAGATLAFNQTGSVTFSNTISSGVGVSQAGTGMLTLTSTANSFTGGIAISSGTLQVYSDPTLGGTGGGITFAGSGVIRSGSTASLVSTRNIAINSGVTGTIDTNGNNLTVNGVISGATGALTKIGSGNLILAGADTYGGATTINNGTIQVNNSLSNSAVAVNNGGNLAGTGTVGGTVTVNGGGAINLSAAVETLTLSNGITIGSNSTASLLDFAGSGGSFSLLNDSASSLSLTGSTTIDINALAGLTAGTYNLITFNSASNIGDITLGTNFVSGKNLSLLTTSTSEELVVAGASAYWTGSNSSVWNTATWAANPAETTGTTAPTSSVDVFFSGNLVTGPVTTSLGANFDINALNFISAGSTTISDGTYGLTIESGGIVMSGGAGAATISATGVAIDANQVWANSSSNSLTVNSPIFGTAVTSSTTTLTLTGTGAGGMLLNGAITDGAAGGKVALSTSMMNAPAVLTGANTYSGGTTITSGTLQVGNGGATGSLGSGPVADTGTLVFDLSGTSTFANVISGLGGSLTQAGSGTLILTGSNTYGGGTTISSGTLQLGDGATTNGYVNTNITDNATLAFANPTAQTCNSVVSGSGSVIKSGSGTLTLGGANTFTGNTIVKSGTAFVAGSVSSSSGVVIGSNGSSGAMFEIALPTNENIATLATASGAAGSTLFMDQSTSAFLTVNGTTTLGSALTVTKFGNPNNFLWAGIAFNGITGGAGAGNDSLIFSNPQGGQQLYIQSNGGTYNYTGNVHFENGGGQKFLLQVLQGSGIFVSTASVTLDSGVFVGNNQASLSAAFDALNGAGTWDNPGGGTASLTVGSAGGSGTFSGIIENSAGTMNFTKTGAGTEVFTGADAYTGATVINAGTLQIGTGGTNGSISSSSAISGSAGGTLVYDLSSSGTISNSISGGINVTQAGSGRLTLAGSAVGYSGTTTVTNGTLIVAGSISGNAIVTGGTFGTTGGSDTIGQNLTVGNGLGAAASSVLDPSLGGGASTTMLNVTGNVTLNSDAAYVFALNSGALGISDGLAVSGTLTLTGALLEGQDIGNTALTPGQDQILIASYGTLNGTFAGLPEGALINIGQNWFSIDYGNINTDEITLTSAAIPEPGTWGTVLVGFAMLIGLQRRRRSKLQ